MPACYLQNLTFGQVQKDSTPMKLADKYFFPWPKPYLNTLNTLKHQRNVLDPITATPCLLWVSLSSTHLEVTVHHAVLVTVVHTLQDLLDAVWSVRLGVELPGYDVFKQLPTRHPVKYIR